MYRHWVISVLRFPKMEFEWDDRNLEHADRHGLTPGVIRELRDRTPKLFANRSGEGRSGSHLLIGPAESGRFWTVVLIHRNEEGLATDYWLAEHDHGDSTLRRGY